MSGLLFDDEEGARPFTEPAAGVDFNPMTGVWTCHGKPIPAPSGRAGTCPSTAPTAATDTDDRTHQ